MNGRVTDVETINEEEKCVDSTEEEIIVMDSCKVPNEDSIIIASAGTPNLWAYIPISQIAKLAEKAMNESWEYKTGPSGEKRYPILRNYLKYTFKRLVYENKIRIGEDRNGIEYASFNTGLVDKKYEDIYAVFKKDNEHDGVYWYLVDWVTAGEGTGKVLVSLFSPLPDRADYFENKISNMLFDTSTGDLSLDYKHILTMRTYRLPIGFLKEQCDDDFLMIDGVSIDDVYDKPERDEKRKEYFEKLGEKIDNDGKIFRRLKNRMDDAIRVTLKRAQWNYKTAIPMYYPTTNTGMLLLPLALVDDDCVDLALVVERQPSGAYQGQTVLPLFLAYNNSRLVTRPDSDWLNVESATCKIFEEVEENVEES